MADGKPSTPFWHRRLGADGSCRTGRGIGNPDGQEQRSVRNARGRGWVTLGSGRGPDNLQHTPVPVCTRSDPAPARSNHSTTCDIITLLASCTMCLRSFSALTTQKPSSAAHTISRLDTRCSTCLCPAVCSALHLRQGPPACTPNSPSHAARFHNHLDRFQCFVPCPCDGAPRRQGVPQQLQHRTAEPLAGERHRHPWRIRA